jgi:thymidylate synthase (FAD)
MKDVKLISCSQGVSDLSGHSPQDIISYVARVSNPHNQGNFRTAAGLLKYCIKHNHWSIFETVSMTMEINTTRGIAAQILRHRSFTFQEFSQRYADTKLLSTSVNVPDLRRQDDKNRQNSISDLPAGIVEDYTKKIEKHFAESQRLYDNLLDSGVAKECARFVLPLATSTRLYMTGNARSWITYINLRCANGTQLEHQLIAEQCKHVFMCVFPDIAKALEWECPYEKCECDEYLQPALKIE